MWRIRPLAAFGLALGPLLAPTCARASAPWPGEAFQPRPSLNIVLCDNAFANTGSYGQPSGIVTSQHTRINVDTQAPRYIQTFNVESVLAGVQIYEPYISFIGSSQIGVRRSIPTPAALSTEASAIAQGTPHLAPTTILDSLTLVPLPSPIGLHAPIPRLFLQLGYPRPSVATTWASP